MKIIRILGIAAAILTGCSSTSERSHTTLRIAINNDPPTIDTRKSSDVLSSVMNLLLNCGLTRITENNEVANDLAESVTVSEDLLTYTFEIKKAFWSDGSPLLAKDFEESWKAALSPDFPAPSAQLLYYIANAKEAKEGRCSLNEVGVKAIDKRTLEVTLASPTPYFLRLTATCTYFPMKESSEGKHISSGPFTLEKWERNDQIVLSANPKFHNRKKIGADKLIILIIESGETALRMYERGELDYIGGSMCHIPMDSVGKYIREGKATLMPLPSTTRLFFNTEVPPFHNSKIRRAISIALNREEIIDAIAPFPAQIATGIVPPMLKRPDAPPPTIEGNASALFKEGLAEEGLENLSEVKFLYPINDMNTKMAQILQEQLHKSLGISIHLEGLHFKQYVHRLFARDFDMAQVRWVAQFNDPINILDCFKYKAETMNLPGWEDSTYIETLNKSATVGNSTERLLLLEKAEQIISNELPICPLFHSSNYCLRSQAASGVYIGSTRPPEWNEVGDD